MIIQTSGGEGGGPIHYQTIVTSQGLVTNQGLVTSGHSPASLNSVVHSAALRLGMVWQLP